MKSGYYLWLAIACAACGRPNPLLQQSPDASFGTGGPGAGFGNAAGMGSAAAGTTGLDDRPPTAMGTGGGRPTMQPPQRTMGFDGGARPAGDLCVIEELGCGDDCQGYEPIDPASACRARIVEGVCGGFRFRTTSASLASTVEFFSVQTGELVGRYGFSDVPSFCDGRAWSFVEGYVPDPELNCPLGPELECPCVDGSGDDLDGGTEDFDGGADDLDGGVEDGPLPVCEVYWSTE